MAMQPFQVSEAGDPEHPEQQQCRHLINIRRAYYPKCGDGRLVSAILFQLPLRPVAERTLSCPSSPLSPGVRSEDAIASVRPVSDETVGIRDASWALIRRR